MFVDFVKWSFELEILGIWYTTPKKTTINKRLLNLYAIDNISERMKSLGVINIGSKNGTKR